MKLSRVGFGLIVCISLAACGGGGGGGGTGGKGGHAGSADGGGGASGMAGAGTAGGAAGAVPSDAGGTSDLAAAGAGGGGGQAGAATSDAGDANDLAPSDGAAGADGAAGQPDAGAPSKCTGVGCQVVDCTAMNKPATSLTGTVYAPNGTLPLDGVNVYVPANGMAPGPLATPLIDHCGAFQGGVALDPSGAPIATRTDDKGVFMLGNLPVVSNLVVVVQTGKWRQLVTLPTITACASAPLPDAKVVLARDHTQGDMPQIAVTTGVSEALECLLRKVGISDAEFSTDAGTGKVHLYAGYGGSDRFPTNAGGVTSTFSAAATLWSAPEKLKQYDLVLDACEGNQHEETKPELTKEAVVAYANAGGRLYLSHWQNIWLQQQDWVAIASWNFANGTPSSPIVGNVNTTFPGGAELSRWLVDLSASTIAGQFPILGGGSTCIGVSPMAKTWTSITSGGGGVDGRIFELTTPLTSAVADRRGRVVFTDVHASGDSTSVAGAAGAFPLGCASTSLSAQDKALAFMIFQLGSCIGP